uniref:F-box GID2-like protein n=1 Tax=Physcomitrium patens TaxID=3218 RepID=A9LY25_PHYPA|nr:F-box GID2-like protein [Physcomitrium patens]
MGEKIVDHEMSFLSSDLICEILNRVDVLTLAKANCVTSEFRYVFESEACWERHCNLRWPSTKQTIAKDLISKTGGFRKFYANCYPCLSGRGAVRAECDDKVESLEACPLNFFSIIDVMYKGQPMLSKTVPVLLDADDSIEWFEDYPFQLDLSVILDEVVDFHKDEGGIPTLTIQTELSGMKSAETSTDGSLWRALNENMTVSWILINKKSGEMANFASWKPLGGLRHWPSEDNFVLHFGTIIPSDERFPNDPVHCNVTVKVRFSVTEIASAGSKTTICITECGMKLENVDGDRLHGLESVEFTHRALGCGRTVSLSTVLESYQEFGLKQLARNVERVRRENLRELTAAVISGIGVFLCLCHLLL